MHWRKNHRKAERYAAEAEFCYVNGDKESALILYMKSAEEEENAMNAVNRSNARTYGITASSAAALFFKCKEYDRAEAIAKIAMKDHGISNYSRIQLQRIIDGISEIRRKQSVEIEKGPDWDMIDSGLRDQLIIAIKLMNNTMERIEQTHPGSDLLFWSFEDSFNGRKCLSLRPDTGSEVFRIPTKITE